MTRLLTYFTSTVALAFAISLAGCAADSEEATPKDGAQSSSSDHDGHDHGVHSDQAYDGQTAMEKMKAELEKMSPEDAASAEKQHMCPVSGEMLGTMGPPKKVEVNGREVWICCESCEAKIKADPEKYLAKLRNE